MIRYMFKRLFAMVPILIAVSFIIYMIFTLAPGDAVMSMDAHMSKAKVTELKHNYHLDESRIVQYLRWFYGAIHGDFGISYKLKEPVVKIINKYIWNSFYLQFASFILSIMIAIPVGVMSAVHKNSFFDGFFTTVSFIGISIPTFFLGLILIKWFAVDLNILPTEGMTTVGENLTGIKKVLDIGYHMILPCMVLTFVNAASLVRYIRSSMLEVINKDYIMVARSKGLKERVVIYKHAFKNAMIPVVTILGMSIANLFTGAVVTEEIFGWPGIGKLSLDAVFQRDYPLLMGINMITVVLLFVGNLAADIIYVLIDPRIKYK